MKPASAPSVSAWWLLVAALVGLQLGLLLVRPGASDSEGPVWVLLPMMPLTGAQVERDLIEAGLLLLPDTEGGEMDHLGNRLAQRLGRSAWLGPTMSVDDFTVGLAHLGGEPELALDPEQQTELQPILERLHQVRGELERSEHEMRRMADQLACARHQLILALGPEQREALARTLPPGGGAR